MALNVLVLQSAGGEEERFQMTFEGRDSRDRQLLQSETDSK